MKNKDTSPGDREQNLAAPSAAKVVEAVATALHLEPGTLQEANALLREAREKLAVAEAARHRDEVSVASSVGGMTEQRAIKLKALREGNGSDPAEKQREAANAMRDEIKAKASVRGGLKQYTNPSDPAYRMGVYYPVGSLIELPPEEDPSFTWLPVTKSDFKPAGITVTADDRIAMSQMQERNVRRAADMDVTVTK